jgi:P-type Ca2+ transporter type 2C
MTDPTLESAASADSLPPGGLSSPEAARRLAEHGPNILVPRSRFSALLHWLKTLADPMTLLLLVAAVVYFALGEERDAWVLIVSIIPIFAVDLFLEARTDRALKGIRAMTVRTARVLRDSVRVEIPVEALVPGDRVLIEEGEIFPADGVLVEGSNVEVDESPLTGESVPVPKEPGDPRRSEVYAGTRVLYGRGSIRLLSTGRETRYGQIGHKMAEMEEERTPLQRKIGALVIRLGLGAAAVCLLLIAAEKLRGSGWEAAFLAAVSLAIAAIPEEFPVVFSLYLTLGVARLARKKALMRRMVGVETLGSTTVICTDKTGTLTEGRLSVAEQAARNGRDLWEAIVLACEVDPSDPLEKVMVEHAREHGVLAETVHRRWSMVRDYPFDRRAKIMSHVWRDEKGGLFLCAKGAVEGIAGLCRRDPAALEEMQRENSRLAGSGMRVIAVAAARLEGLADRREENERDLAFLGLVGFSDPPRREVKRSLAACREAGIRVVMITGDHPLTAHNIAESIGLDHEDDQIVTGEELERMNEEEFSRRAARANIFARVMPLHKHRLVQALKLRGEVVAMTGDGINDALALKEANIGVAMGMRGTEAARAAATMVLLDDNFQTIVEAVAEGRRVFSRIQKAFRYLITLHTPVLALAVLVPLLGLPLLLVPVIIIWIELIMHPTVALVFEADVGDPRAMSRPPREPSRPLLTAGEMIGSLLTGGSITLAVLALYVFRLRAGSGVPEARSVAVTGLILAENLLVALELLRGTGAAALANRLFWITRALTLGILLLFLYAPLLAGMMQMAPISPRGWMEAAAAACVSTLIVEAVAGMGAALRRGRRLRDV